MGLMNSSHQGRGGCCPATTSSRRHPTPSRATQRRSTTPNATFGSHLARFARPDCATEPVRIVPSNPSSQIPDGATPWNSSMPHRTCPNCAKQPVLSDLLSASGRGARAGGAGPRSIRRVLQPRAAARSHRQRDAGRHVPRSPARDPEPQRKDQTLDVGTKEERESTQRGLAANGSENPL